MGFPRQTGRPASQDQGEINGKEIMGLERRKDYIFARRTIEITTDYVLVYIIEQYIGTLISKKGCRRHRG
jgi:hypothetical protein